jgi:hypothetical protein
MVSPRLSRRAEGALGQHRICGVGTIGYPSLFLFASNVAVDDLDDTVEIGNRYPSLHRFPKRGAHSHSQNDAGVSFRMLQII